MRSILGDVEAKIGMFTRGYNRHKFGRNSITTAGANNIVWPLSGTTYPWPTSAQQVSIVSTSLEDTPAGAGIDSIIIFGLDANYDEIEEIVVLDGTNPVLTTQSYIRVNRMINASPDSNLGNITASHGADVLAIVETGRNQTEQCILTVPRGQTLLLTSALYAATANREISYSLWAELFPGVARIQQQWGGYASSAQIVFDPVLAFSEGVDIYITANPSTNNEAAIAELWGYTVPITGYTSVERYVNKLG